ncbi:hypothetical protein N4G70_17540 [Streptomyces sp. ASQP_92]|uniref:hypothetical protein n=1 Tax=Streptomyces sp. ASQP_92 TaxID=2979116 RepID=UPI0021C0E8D0|nr:hypothetical protein [Streptomyces sp. ASQP_92]MCT9090645.1 hypothetical protein [Streptomyces sp. ASQP_92]
MSGGRAGEAEGGGPRAVGGGQWAVEQSAAVHAPVRDPDTAPPWSMHGASGVKGLFGRVFRM